MSAVVGSVGARIASLQRVSRDGYRVSIAASPDEAEGLLRSLGPEAGASPFQTPVWQAAWLATLGRGRSVAPLVAHVSDAVSGATAMVVPLIAVQEAGRRIVEFADLGLTDYNAPLLGPAAPDTAPAAARAWRALKRALPDADAIRLIKMPTRIGAKPNPLALLPSALPSPLRGHVLDVPCYESFLHARGRFRRKETERAWRVFQRLGGTAFEQIVEIDGALRLLDTVDRQQRRRMAELGRTYALDGPGIGAFYRLLIETGLGSGYVVMTALRAGEQTVAALMGVRHGTSVATVRLSNAAGRWLACSPGRLVVARTMEHLAMQGCTSFDFSVGDYEFKRRLGGERLPLVEVVEAMSWRGIAVSGPAAAKGRLRRYPRLASGLRRLLSFPRAGGAKQQG